MTTSNRFFTDAQKDLLASILNRIIPPDGNLPGAGDLGLAEFVEDVVGRRATLKRLFSDGLTNTEITAGRRDAVSFRALADDVKDAVLKDVETSNPEFFEELVRQTYNGYYTNPQVFQGLDYAPPTTEEAESPPELLDESILEQQRKRAPFWRRA
jgi:hypothetical protein